MKVLCGHQSAKCSWQCPRDQGQGRVSVGTMPELCLWKLLCKVLKAVAPITVLPTPAAFFSIYHALSSDVPVRKVSCPSPFASTDEATECQLARGSAGPAAGAWHLLLWGRLVARSKGAHAWGLRTLSLEHLLWSSAEAEFSAGPVWQHPEKCGVFSQGDLPVRHSSLPDCLKSS